MVVAAAPGGFIALGRRQTGSDEAQKGEEGGGKEIGGNKAQRETQGRALEEGAK